MTLCIVGTFTPYYCSVFGIILDASRRDVCRNIPASLTLRYTQCLPLGVAECGVSETTCYDDWLMIGLFNAMSGGYRLIRRVVLAISLGGAVAAFWRVGWRNDSAHAGAVA